MRKPAADAPSPGASKTRFPLAHTFGLAAWIALLAPAAARAATFAVTTTADGNHGACTVSLCTLRDAVIAANANAGADVITLPAGTYTLTIPGTGEDAAATGDLDITGDLTINGAGASTTIVDGGAIDRVFDVIGGITVTFNDLTIRNGAPPSSDNGAGIQSTGVGFRTLNINRCVISGNHATVDGSGGGLFNQSSTVTITDTTITGNSAGTFGQGGGIYNISTVTINNSTVSGNSSGDTGGGIYNNNQVTMTNCTVTGNTGSDGGGIDAEDVVDSINSTISNNTSTGGTGGGILRTNGRLRNTIIANNSPGNCSDPVTNLGTNLQFPGATCGGTIPTADPLLQGLASNGGPTQTQALSLGSPALNAASGCPPPATDQRGVSRPQGSACEIGSFECQTGECGVAGATPTPTVTPAVTATPVTSATPTATPVVGVAVVPTLSPPWMALLGLALACAAILLLKKL